MTKHVVSPFTPPVIAPERFAGNGMVPSASVARRLAHTFNFIACVQRRQVCMRSRFLNNVGVGIPTDEETWPTFFTSGENADSITIVVGLAMLDTATTTPYAEIEVVEHATDTVVELVRLDYSALTNSAGTPLNDIAHRQHKVSGLVANTDYYVRTYLRDGARLVYMAINERVLRSADDTVDGVCDPGGFVDEGPIYDSHIADLVTANNLLWQHNASHLLDWSAERSNWSTSVSDAAYTNQFDNTTAVATNSIGFCLFTQYHNTRNRSAIPVRFAVNAMAVSPGVGTLWVRITDGTNVIEFPSITGTPPGYWHVMDATVPPQAGVKWDIQAKVSGGNWYLNAVTLQEFEP